MRNANRNIDWVKNPSPDSTIWRSMNYGEVSFTGVESSLSYIPASTTQRIISLKISYTYLSASKDNSGLLSRYVFDFLKHQISISADLRIAGNFFISNRISYSDRNGTFQNKSGVNQPYKPFWLADTKLYRKSNHLTLYLEASNVFNTNYEDFGGIIQPGRWVKAGIVLEIGY
jgi:vitamin B12 transporter